MTACNGFNVLPRTGGGSSLDGLFTRGFFDCVRRIASFAVPTFELLPLSACRRTPDAHVQVASLLINVPRLK